MSWLVEQPLTILLVTLMVEAGLFAWLYQTGRQDIPRMMMIAAGVGGLLLLLAWLVVTDREQVDHVLRTIARAIERDDLETVLDNISPRSRHVGNDARLNMKTYRIEEVSIKSNLKIEINRRVDPRRAVATFNAVLVGGDKNNLVTGQQMPLAFVLTFEKEDGRWRLREYEVKDFREGLRRKD